jgi:hypothetical protein
MKKAPEPSAPGLSDVCPEEGRKRADEGDIT